MKKKKLIWIIIVLIFISILFIYLNYKFPSNKLFDYNLIEILTALVITFGIFYLTKLSDDIKSRNEKIEDVIDLLKNKLNSVFDCPIMIEKQAEYLYSFKYIDNKIFVLEKLATHLNCTEDIKEIKNEKQKLDDFINENIGGGNEYFLRERVKEKVPNILCNVESHLDNIILKIYDDK